jgi:hypothetical protein
MSISRLTHAQNNYDTPRIYHQGIASAWLSKSPIENLDDYRGDADWFNIESVLEPTEQSLDWSLPENERWYDSLYSLWGTYMVDSVSQHLDASKYIALRHSSGTLLFPLQRRPGSTFCALSISIQTSSKCSGRL